MSYIKFDGVKKIYTSGNVSVAAVDGVSFEIEKGEFCVIVGPSGAGKTTVLNMLGGMDGVTSGQIVLDGRQISAFDKKQLTAYRRYDVGFVFQFYNLVQNLTALENVELASQICREPMDAREALRAVGLEERMNNFPAQLSGGEQQRVAIARALAKNPKLLLCDEPTGALDSKTSRDVLQLLQKINVKYRTTILLITHNENIAPMADRILRIHDGRIVENIINTRKPVKELDI